MQQPRSSGFICGLVAIGLLTAVVILTAPAQAASGNGPYYATPSWDQKLPAATRFVVLTDWNSEAVLDRETGLVWEKSPNLRVVPWSAARSCINKMVAGRHGWRLPSISELTSLIDNTTTSPALPLGHPFADFTGNNYWSATTNADNPNEAWRVDLNGGFVLTGDKALTFAAWCVRGGNNADQY